MIRKKIIQTAIGLMAMVASFLPQQVEAAFCSALCITVILLPDGSSIIKISYCEIVADPCDAYCDANGNAVCLG